jgi:hypothetical protein
MFQKILISCCMALACTPAHEKMQKDILCQQWIHAFEEDDKTKPDEIIFRSSAVELPRARGRDGFEIKPDGEVLMHQIGPADGNMIVHGKWKLNDKELTFTFENEMVVYQILLIEKDKLVLRRER